VTAQYAPTVLQTISNPDGTVSIIQVDPNNPIITLPDGTTAQVQGVATVSIVGVHMHVVFMCMSLDSIQLCLDGAQRINWQEHGELKYHM
jgi:hypothetical protein